MAGLRWRAAVVRHGAPAWEASGRVDARTPLKAHPWGRLALGGSAPPSSLSPPAPAAQPRGRVVYRFCGAGLRAGARCGHGRLGGAGTAQS